MKGVLNAGHAELPVNLQNGGIQRVDMAYAIDSANLKPETQINNQPQTYTDFKRFEILNLRFEIFMSQ